MERVLKAIQKIKNAKKDLDQVRHDLAIAKARMFDAKQELAQAAIDHLDPEDMAVDISEVKAAYASTIES